MFKWMAPLFASLFLFSGCSTMQISTDHDPQFNFAALNSFTVLLKEEKAEDTLTDTHLSRAIQNDLSDKGYIQTDKENADFYILFHLDVQDKTEVQTTYESWDIHPYPYYLHDRRHIPPYPYYNDPFNVNMMVGTTQTFEYQEGQLIIDAYDPQSKKVFWRGIAKDELRSFKSAEEKIEYLNKVVGELFKDFPAQATGE